MISLQKSLALITLCALTVTLSLSGCDRETSREFPSDEIVADNNIDVNTEINIPSYEQGKRPVLKLSLVGAKVDNDNLELAVDLFQPLDLPGARVMELFLKFSDNLEYVSANRGSTVDLAEKSFVSQVQDDHRLRVLVYSASNMNTMETGRVFVAKFKKNNDDRASIEITAEKPIFAPQEANNGLIVSDPLEI